MKHNARALKPVLVFCGLIVLVAYGQAAAQPQAGAKLEVLGDYAGRKLKLTVDGKVEWDGYGHLNPQGMSWFITVNPGDTPAPIELQIEPCEQPFTADIPRDGATRALIIQGCEIRLVK